MARKTSKTETNRVEKPAVGLPVPEALEHMPLEEKLAVYRFAKAYIAGNEFSPQGFECFYELVIHERMPRFFKEKVIPELFTAVEKGEGFAAEAFRGSTKTTTLTVAFLAYFIGHHPEKANSIIQVTDQKANESGKHIADIVEYNQGWKMIFPHVVPDKDKGWSANGYEVKATKIRKGDGQLHDVTYEQWRQLNAKRQSPTLLAVGYTSGLIIGGHPDGILVLDDILNLENTRSQRELATVTLTIQSTIIPTAMKGCFKMLVFTPWLERDPIVMMANSGNYRHVKIPAFERDPEGTDEWEGEKVTLAWPEMFPISILKERLRDCQPIEFARMYLLDLKKAKGIGLKYIPFPSSAVIPNWPMLGGIDYAGTMNAAKNASGENDYFAMAYVAKHPEGGAIVVDGVLERCTQSESETYALRAQQIFPNWQFAVVEGDGKGEEFIQVMMRHPSFKYVPQKTGGKGKQERLFRQMGPWLEGGRVRISDAQTPFLNELRRELEQYPLGEHDDCLDALYWALRGMPDVLQMPVDDEKLPSVQRVKKTNPFNAFGRR